MAIREAETAGFGEQCMIGTWSATGVLSQWVRKPDDGGAAGWREFDPSRGVAEGAGGIRKAAELWVTFHTEQRGPYGGAPEVFALVGGQRVEGVQLE